MTSSKPHHLTTLTGVLVCRPFYRSEMMIVTAKNSSQFWKENVGKYAASGGKLWGPALRIGVLNEVGGAGRREAWVGQGGGRRGTGEGGWRHVGDRE